MIKIIHQNKLQIQITKYKQIQNTSLNKYKMQTNATVVGRAFNKKTSADYERTIIITQVMLTFFVTIGYVNDDMMMI